MTPLQLIAPKLRYCGVTLELEFPSRHDTKELCSGSAAYVLKEAFETTGGLSRYNCELRVKSVTAPFREGTKVVLLCGESAIRRIGHDPARLNVLRGSPFLHDGIVYIPTYHPQQCADKQNYEKRFNVAAHDTADSVGTEADSDSDEGAAKDMGKTARRNFRFWFIHDLRKAISIARNGFTPNQATYHTNLTADGILNTLRSGSGKPFYLDIETNPFTGQMICFAWSFDTKDIYVAPVLNYSGGTAYQEGSLHHILRALATAMDRASVVVAHNALFDLFILAWRYKIPPPRQDRIWDTMVAHARCHVDTEKSLGHCTSLYTQQPYHKDEGIFCPSNYNQWQQLLTYNAKDVETTALVHEAQLRLADADPGLAASIEQGNALVRPLLLKSLRGLYINKDALCARIDELTKRQQFVEQRILAPLAGGPVNPRSPNQVCELLYTKFGLPKSSDPTVSLTGKDALYRLALKCPIPTLKVILHCRALSKEVGTLHMQLWRDSHTTCGYKITGTKTFRLSSQKLLGVWGTNLQNWSKRMRAMVVAHSGKVLVQVDQSGAEALVVAYLSPAGRYRDLFIHKVSPHVYFGLFAFPDVWKAELGYDITYLHEASIAECKADKRWTEISRCIKASDNNPPARRYYYFQKQINHCVKAGYKVLTPDGWKLIEENPPEIACYDSRCELTQFERVVWNNFDYTGLLYHIHGKEFDQEVTPNHTVAYWSNDKQFTTTAERYEYKYKGSSIKVGVNFIGGADVEIALIGLTLALQADGHIHKDCNRWTFRFGKERKSERLKTYLDVLGVRYKECLDTDLYTKITVIPCEDVYQYLSKSDKTFNLAKLINLSTRLRKFICEEVFKWDGTDESHIAGHQTVYRTTNKFNAETVYTLLRISGWGATLTQTPDYFTVSRNARTLSRTTSIVKHQYTGTVHCPTTRTGYFLIMSPNGKISVTGNSSNYDIKAQRFAANLLEKSEGQVSLPVSECERLLNTYHRLYPEIRGGFQRYVRDQLYKYHLLRNLFGYPRRFYGWVEGDDTILKDAYSWIPQSTIGCITGLADSSLQARIDRGEIDCAVWQNNHDSLLVECDEGNEKDIARVVCDAMNIRMVSPRGEEFSMRSEASVGKDWYHMEEMKI